jgi:hypothetical protein
MEVGHRITIAHGVAVHLRRTLLAFIRPSSAKQPAMSLPNIRSQATMEVPVDASMGRPQSSRLAWDRQRILAGLRECPAVITK